MSKSQKKWLIAAACLVAVGAVIFVGAMAALDFDFTKLSTVDYATHTYEISEAFHSISVETETADIVFLPHDGDTCKIVSTEQEGLSRRITVNDGTLQIKANNEREWYDYIGIFLGNTKVTVYLPEKEYNTFFISTDTGDIRLTDVSCQYLDVQVDTGDVTLKNTIATEHIAIETDTGDVKFNASDAPSISVKTDTGDVSGSVLSEKVFICRTDTGDIKVPETTEGGLFKINTDTGDIKITIAK